MDLTKQQQEGDLEQHRICTPMSLAPSAVCAMPLPPPPPQTPDRRTHTVPKSSSRLFHGPSSSRRGCLVYMFLLEPY
jgi:hypothetical protein